METQGSTAPDAGLVPAVFEGKGKPHILVYVDEPTRDQVGQAVLATGASTLDMWHYSNLLAIGADLAIVDPCLFSEDDWTNLCKSLEEMNDHTLKILLVAHSPYRARLPKYNIERSPGTIDSHSIAEVILRVAGRASRAQQVWRKKERQMSRLMYMLYRLDTATLRVRDVSERFDVSTRTVQRDIEVLLVAGYPIEEAEEPGTYRFPIGYRSYMVQNH